MSSLTIKRDSGYADRLRRYRVLVDGSEIGKIGNGETKTFQVAPGKHELLLKIDWCRSKPIEFLASEGASVTFLAKSNLRGLKLVAALWYALFAWNSWLVLERCGSDSKSAA